MVGHVHWLYSLFKLCFLSQVPIYCCNVTSVGNEQAPDIITTVGRMNRMNNELSFYYKKGIKSIYMTILWVQEGINSLN